MEFNRQWNRQLGNPLENLDVSEEDVIYLENTLTKGSKLNVNSKLYSFLRKDNFNGVSHELNVVKTIKSFELSGLHGITKSNSLLAFKEQNEFNDYGLEVAKFFKQSKVGFGYRAQESRFSYDSSENIGTKSFAYNNKYAYVNVPYKETNSIEIRGEIREDRRPLQAEFKESSLSRNIGVHVLSEGDPRNRLEIDLTYRDYEVLDSNIFPGQSEDNLLSKFQYNFRWFKNAIRGNTFLNVGTGREQRREYTYLEVQAGRGFYVWNDYNENGIKELNEFEESIFQDQANFIRIITPTNEFVKSNTNDFNQTLKVQGPKSWSQKRGLRKFLYRFSTNSAWRISRKNTKNDFFALVNPFDNNIESENLIYTKFFTKHTLFFNRLSAKYSIEYTRLSNKNKTLINNGFDSRNESLDKFKARINITSKIALINEVIIGNKGFDSDFFDSRNYLYDYYEIMPSLNWVFSRSFRTTWSYKNYYAENRPFFGLENTRNEEFTVQLVYNALEKGNMDASFSYIDVKYNGTEGNTLSYDMLKGLTNGTNLKWVLGIGKRFSNHMQLRLEYNGRQIGESPIVHVGSVQARYLF